VTYRIGVLGGDGIGREVTAEAVKCLDATGVDYESVTYDLGGERFLRDGVILPDEDLASIRGLDALLFGAVGWPEVPPGTVERGIILALRFALDQYINLRPFRSNNGLLGRPVDFVVVRENTEGTYAGEGGFLRKDTPYEIATQGSVNTRFGVERCVRYAFELAMTRPAKKLTLVHKTNVLTFAGNLWERTFNEVKAEYPDITTSYDHIDAACIHMVERPERYDVIVTDNLFGDILTDLAGAVAGGIGRAASGNLNPDRTAPSMFEPVHGSAPDIAGQQKADPRAAIISMQMMLEFLGETDAANRVEKALAATDDVRGSTAEIGDAVAAAI